LPFGTGSGRGSVPVRPSPAIDLLVTMLLVVGIVTGAAASTVDAVEKEGLITCLNAFLGGLVREPASDGAQICAWPP